MNEAFVEPYVGSDGRMKVVLKNYDTGIDEECDLAWIVARTFLPNPPKNLSILPMFRDGNSKNCSTDNLFWA